MRTIAWTVAAVLTAALLSLPLWLQGQADVTSMTPQAELQFTERVVDAVRRGDTKAVMTDMVPENRPSDPGIVAKLGALFPKGTSQIEVTAWRTTIATGHIERTMIELVYDYGSAGLIRVQALLDKTNGALRLAGIDIRAFPAAAARANDFRLPTLWSDPRWPLLALAAALDVLAFGTLILCLVNANIRWRWRWLWLLFIAAGLIRVNLDWVTLQYQVMLLNFMAPPAGFYRFAAYGPWVLSLALPVGAVVYWTRARRWARESEAHRVATF
jgi:hypothetical protein